MARLALLLAVVASGAIACTAEPASRVVAFAPPTAPVPSVADLPDAAETTAPGPTQHVTQAAPFAPADRAALAGRAAPAARASPIGPPAPVAPAPPPPLACIVRYYKATARHEGDKWFLVLPDGTEIPYAGRRIPIGNGYYWPNVIDIYEQRYPTGPIYPITQVDFDPGAMRLDPLFYATYGKTAKEVRAALVRVHIGGTVFLVHRRVAEPLRRVAVRIKAAIKKDPGLRRFFRSTGGSFNWRHIAGTSALSSHGWGIAVDLGTKRADYWRYHTKNPDGPIKWRNRYPQAIVDSFEAEGFIWGGRWYHYDTMHFEYRPELLDPKCYPR